MSVLTILALSFTIDITAVRSAHWKVDEVFFKYGWVTQSDTANQDKDGRDMHRLHGAGRNEQPRTRL